MTEHVVGGLFRAVTREIVCPFFGITPTVGEGKEGDDGGKGREGWKDGWLEVVKEIPLRGNW